MSLNPVLPVPSREETKEKSPSKVFYEVSFLNTISLVFLNPENPHPKLSLVQRIKDLVLSCKFRWWHTTTSFFTWLGIFFFSTQRLLKSS